MMSSPPLPLPSPPPAPPPPNSLSTSNFHNNNNINSRPSSQLSHNGSSGYGSTTANGRKDHDNQSSSASTPPNKSPTSCEDEEASTNTSKKRSVTWDGSVKGGQFDHRPPSLRLNHNQRPPILKELDEEDPGLDLIEAEVDSDDEAGPRPAPRTASINAKTNPCYMNMQMGGDVDSDVPPPPPPPLADPTLTYGITLPTSHHPLRATQSTETMQVSGLTFLFCSRTF